MNLVDLYSSPIHVGSRVAFNYGGLRRGKVIDIKWPKYPRTNTVNLERSFAAHYGVFTNNRSIVVQFPFILVEPDDFKRTIKFSNPRSMLVL